MLQTYINFINHNRYLKTLYNNSYLYSKLDTIKLTLKFSKDLNNKFIILCLFFLFKEILFKNGYFIILNKKSKKILGMKFILKHNLMYNYMNFLISNFLNQPEIQNNIYLNSFDTNNNFIFNIKNSYYYYLEKYINNPYFKKILSYFSINTIFIFKNSNNLLDNILYLNMFKFYFI